MKVDLLNDFPKRINVGLRKKSGEVIDKWININYDHFPKYCGNYKIQGHNEQEFYVLHPELYSKTKEKKENKKPQETSAKEKESMDKKEE